MVVNPLVIRAGATIIWYGPAVPFLGRWTYQWKPCTLELCRPQAAGDHEQIRPLQPDGQPGQCAEPFFPGGRQIGADVALATRMFPTMVRDLKRIKKCCSFAALILKRAAVGEGEEYSSLYNVMLAFLPEDSMEIAESMQARLTAAASARFTAGTCCGPGIPQPGRQPAGSGPPRPGAAQRVRAHAFYPVADVLIRDSSTLAALVVVFFYWLYRYSRRGV